MPSIDKKRKPPSRSVSDDSLSSYDFGDSYGFTMDLLGGKVAEKKPKSTDVVTAIGKIEIRSNSSVASGNDDVRRPRTRFLDVNGTSSSRSSDGKGEITNEGAMDIGSSAIACYTNTSSLALEVESSNAVLFFDGTSDEQKKDVLHTLLDKKKESKSLTRDADEDNQLVERTLVILVVDDSSVQRKLSRNSLAHKSAEFNLQILVNTVENGERALEMYGSKDSIPDVMIIDEYMSSMGGRILGHEVVETCRSRPEFAHCVIIGCTAKSDISSRSFMEAGCDAVWIKPMPKKLEALRQIMELVKQRKMSSQDSTLDSPVLRKENLAATERDQLGEAAQQAKYSVFSEWSQVPSRFKFLHLRGSQEAEPAAPITPEGMEIFISESSDSISTISGSFI